jgi:putative ABC transport system permease protein
MAFVKDMLRMWIGSWRRFISIALITMLGVAVLTGIYAGCRDAFLATDRFFDNQGLHDVQVLSTAGLTEDDITALKQVNGVEKVQPERSQNVTVNVNGRKSVTLREIGVNGIDQPYLQEGRMPKKAGEIAVTKQFIKDSGYAIGTEITVETEDSAQSDDQMPSFPTELTIVGIVLDPQNLSNPDGYSGMTSFRSTSTSDYTFFAPSDGVTGTLYTGATLLVSGAADENTYGSVYESKIGEVVDRIDNDVKGERQKARRQELLDQARESIDQAKSQLEERKNQAAQAAQLLLQTGQITQEELAAQSQQLTQAEQQLQDEEDKLESSIPTVRWYVQDRSQMGGFSALKSDLESIQSIGNAFPIVFLIVAVMMSLTSMARKVEEDRGLIGTYMALGYGHVKVALRYVLFALLACLVGGGFGVLLGFVGIPAFLLTVLKGMYVMPGVRLEYDPLYGTAGTALFVVGVVGATIYACLNEMRQLPSMLMRPKPPRAGSRIFLERIKPVWTRMGFLSKVTARNIVRFKSRLIMTIGGVAGCTALIVCGLAINDTVAELGMKQYCGVYQYDLMVVASDSDADAMRRKIQKDGNVASNLNIRIESGDLTADDGSESVQLVVVPEDSLNELGDMITLQPVKTGWAGFERPSWLGGSETADTVELDDDGVIVAQSAANVFGITAGSTVTLTSGDGVQAEATVSEVTRNLIGSDVYVSEQYYREIFDVDGASDGASDGSSDDSADSSSDDSSDDNELVWNAMYATLKGNDQSQIDYAQTLEEDDSITKAVSCADMAESFKFDLMGAVVALIVAFAGGLALVVLFTLANTNVSERVREMATLKVLGFFDNEVHRYVNREMMLLTVMGVIVGLPFGRWVGGLLTAALNMPSLYFEVEVKPLSYVIAAAVTMAFAIVVQLFVNPVLDRIEPVTSLKSVE